MKTRQHYVHVVTNDSDRPKFPFHLAVTMALLNAKRPLSLPEIQRFITKYIPGWHTRSGYICCDSHYNRRRELYRTAAKAHWQYYLVPDVSTFEERIKKIMEPFTDRSSKDYGLANPDDWEALIRGELKPEMFGSIPEEALDPPTPVIVRARSEFIVRPIKNEVIEHYPNILTFKREQETISTAMEAIINQDQQTPMNKEAITHGLENVAVTVDDRRKLDIRWIVDLAVLYYGNNVSAFNIFEFVANNFPEYRDRHNWKEELMTMVGLNRIKVVSTELHWQNHYALADKEIIAFRSAIYQFMDAHPDTSEKAYGLDDKVKWEEVFPSELMLCISQYLRKKSVFRR